MRNCYFFLVAPLLTGLALMMLAIWEPLHLVICVPWTLAPFALLSWLTYPGTSVANRRDIGQAVGGVTGLGISVLFGYSLALIPILDPFNRATLSEYMALTLIPMLALLPMSLGIYLGGRLPFAGHRKNKENPSKKKLCSNSGTDARASIQSGKPHA